MPFGPELFTLQSYLAMQPQGKDDAERAARVQASREKASEWLSKNESKDSPQTASFRLLVDLQPERSGNLLQPGIDRILDQQNDDGGWSQEKDRASDAYMTGQALYALSRAGVPNYLREIQLAVSFLVTSQNEDGSWPMTSRKAKNQVPIIYFGSAWATLGLTRTVGNAAEPAPRTSKRARQPDARSHELNPTPPVLWKLLRDYGGRSGHCGGRCRQRDHHRPGWLL